MKRPASIFLLIIVAFVAAVALAFVAPASVSVDFFAHHLSAASIAAAAPSYTINEWLKLRRPNGIA
jgi:hypothetical protein